MTDYYAPIFNEVLEALCRMNLSSYETRVLMAIWRRTYGFIDTKTGERKKYDLISVSLLSEMCDLDKRHISRALKGLKEKNVICRDDKKTGFSKNFMRLTSSVQGIPSTGDTPSPLQAPQIESINRNILYIAKNTKKTVKPKEHFMTEEEKKEILSKYSLQYPDVNMPREVEKMDNWCRSKNRKYVSYPHFAAGWLERSFGDKEKDLGLKEYVKQNPDGSYTTYKK